MVWHIACQASFGSARRHYHTYQVWCHRRPANSPTDARYRTGDPNRAQNTLAFVRRLPILRLPRRTVPQQLRELRAHTDHELLRRLPPAHRLWHDSLAVSPAIRHDRPAAIPVLGLVQLPAGGGDPRERSALRTRDAADTLWRDRLPGVLPERGGPAAPAPARGRKHRAVGGGGQGVRARVGEWGGVAVRRADPAATPPHAGPWGEHARCVDPHVCGGGVPRVLRSRCELPLRLDGRPLMWPGLGLGPCSAAPHIYTYRSSRVVRILPPLHSVSCARSIRNDEITVFSSCRLLECSMYGLIVLLRTRTYSHCSRARRHRCHVGCHPNLRAVAGGIRA